MLALGLRRLRHHTLGLHELQVVVEAGGLFSPRRGRAHRAWLDIVDVGVDLEVAAGRDAGLADVGAIGAGMLLFVVVFFVHGLGCSASIQTPG